MKVRKPFYGWLVVLVGAMIAFSSGPGQSYGFSVFIPSITDETGLSETTISLLYAVGTGVSAVMVAMVSRMADRFGPRIMAVLIATLMGFACFAMAGASGFISFFFAFAALRALGQGSLPINATLLTAIWFVTRRGRAMAVMGLGFAASSAIIPPLGRALIDSIGWREAYLVFGVMVWLLVIPGVLLIVRNSPEEMGLHPDGFDHPPVSEPAPVQRDARGRDTRKVFSSLTFWLIALPLATPSLVVTAIIFFQTSLFQEQGLSAGVAANVFPVMALASASTALIAGPIVDRIGPVHMVRANLGILVIATLYLRFIETPLMAVGYALLLGMAGGVWQIVNSTTWAYLYGRHGLGRIQGSATMVGICAAAVGPLPLSALRDLTGSYDVALGVMSGLLVLGIVVISFARPQPMSQNVMTAPAD